MDDNNKSNCWKWLLLGLLALGLLWLLAAFFGKSNAKNLERRAKDVAQEALDKGQYGFAMAEVANSVMVIKGAASDQATKLAACDTATKGLKDKGMIGFGGVVTTLSCQISAPGDAIAAAPITKKPDAVIAQKGDSAACQTKLNEASQTAKVGFAKSAATIESGQEMLDKVADVAKSCANFKIEVAGHTDTGGDAAMNMNLSQNRAQSVRSYLISKGVNANQLSAKGYGETKPLVDDHAVMGVDNPERQKNRRTEFNITAQ
jgi:outer membrane protein OmpA-like peptidoglycan-associated protein